MEHAPDAGMLKLQVRTLRPFLKNGVMNICMMFLAFSKSDPAAVALSSTVTIAINGKA